jgi:hypothetical protein
MTVKISVYNLAGEYIEDPEGAIRRATNITFNSASPKGFMEGSFQVKRSDVFATWIIQESYGVIFWDDSEIVYQGRIETKPRDLSGVGEHITIQCTGWWVVFEERDIKKYWIDTKATTRLRWPDGLVDDLIQTRFVNTKRDNIIQVFAGTGDVHRHTGDSYREYYELPAGYVRKIRFRWTGRTGEQINLRVWNLSHGTPYWVATMTNPFTPVGNEVIVRVSTGTPLSELVEKVFTLGNTRDFEIIWTMINDDLYDQNDYIHVANLRVEAHYESGHRFASAPTYTQGQIIEDIVLLVNQKGAQISTDFAQLLDPGIILDPYTVEKRTYAAQVIEEVLRYGDLSLNTWVAMVLSKAGTSDDKPRFILEAIDTSDYEYMVKLSAKGMAQLNYERVSTDLHNNVTVQFTSSRGDIRERRASDNPALADANSITAEYQRDAFIDIGHSDATRADYVGSRFIQFHKDRQTRGTISQKGMIALKGGGMCPTSRVRAGQRVKLINTGEVFYIRYTSYDAETETVRISPDQPQDNLQMLEAQRERNLGRLAGK